MLISFIICLEFDNQEHKKMHLASKTKYFQFSIYFETKILMKQLDPIYLCVIVVECTQRTPGHIYQGGTGGNKCICLPKQNVLLYQNLVL